MKDVIREVNEWTAAGDKVALATVVAGGWMAAAAHLVSGGAGSCFD